MRGLRRWIGAATAPILVLAGVPAMATPAACQLLKIAELGVTTAHNEPLASVAINGHAARMLVDTGAEKSTLWRPALESMGLHSVGTDRKVFGVGGPDDLDIFTVHDFALGGYVVHDIRMYVTGRGARAFAGLLGDDFLSKLDVEFDLSSQTVRLFAPKDCPGDEVVYWAKAYSMVALVHPIGSGDWPLVKVLLNGRGGGVIRQRRDGVRRHRGPGSPNPAWPLKRPPRRVGR